MSHPHSSGDAIADGRHAYAMQYKAAGDFAAAAELVAQALELVPGWAAGWMSLGETQERAGNQAEAVTAYRRALELDPADAAGAGVRLARLGKADLATAVSPSHVAALFDDFAGRFDTTLVDRLRYRGPALIREALDALRSPLAFRRAVDLGCGTGLAGAALRTACICMDGVDISADMLAAARRKRVYDRLELSEIVAFLGREPDASADLLVAADVVVYIGDLAPLLSGAARVLEPGGLFVLTGQTTPAPLAEEDRYALGQDLRFAHTPDGLHASAAEAGLSVASLVEVSIRHDAGHPVPGFVAVLEKTRPED